MSNIRKLRNTLEQQKGKRKQLEKSITETKLDLSQNRKSLKRHEKARELIREAGLKTQQSLAYSISEITSLALETVFDDPYSLEVEFVQRRNKTECDLYFSRDGNRTDPMDASGGGSVDVAAFALRIASWSMMHPKLRPVIILDEPFNRLKGEDANLRVLRMIKEISKKLNIQIIAVSDERINHEDLINNVDRTFLVKLNRRKVSKITIKEPNNESEYSST